MPGAQALGMAITKAQFDAVKAANPGVEIEVLLHDKLPDQVVARVPPPDVWREYIVSPADKRREAKRKLVEACVLFPTGEELRRSFESRPALPGVWAEQISAMAGFSSGARHVAQSGNAAINEQLDRLRALNPGVELEVLQHDRLPDEVIARVPKESEWNIYQQLQGDDKLADATEALIAFCVLWPEKQALTAMTDAHPALTGVWTGELVEMAGYSMKAYRKKF